jgi:hypothetical protein
MISLFVFSLHIMRIIISRLRINMKFIIIIGNIEGCSAFIKKFFIMVRILIFENNYSKSLYKNKH